MDNGQSDYIVKSRDEYIRMARESCVKNLYPESSGKPDVHKKNLYKSYGFREGDSYQSEGEGFLLGFNMKSIGFKFFLIRTICVLVLFLAVIMVDKLNVSFKSFNSTAIEELISSNQSLEKAEDFFVSVFKSLDKGE